MPVGAPTPREDVEITLMKVEENVRRKVNLKLRGTALEGVLGAYVAQPIVGTASSQECAMNGLLIYERKVITRFDQKLQDKLLTQKELRY